MKFGVKLRENEIHAILSVYFIEARSISDYFCVAHNEKKYDNLLIHLIYERKLKKFFEKRLKFMKPMTEFSVSILRSKGSIANHIRNMHEEYSNLKRTMTNDFNYSLKVSTEIAMGIVSCVLENSSSVLMKESA